MMRCGVFSMKNLSKVERFFVVVNNFLAVIGCVVLCVALLYHMLVSKINLGQLLQQYIAIAQELAKDPFMHIVVLFVCILGVIACFFSLYVQMLGVSSYED